MLLNGCTPYQIYVGAHVLSVFVCVGILLIVLWAKPSRGQSGTLLLALSGCIYTFGFLVEITSGNVGGYYAVTLVQYFGECLLMIGFSVFVSAMCRKTVPSFVYAAECVCGIFIMWLLLTTRETGYFYTYIGCDDTGPFPRLVLEYGWGFKFFVTYVVIVCGACIGFCMVRIVKSGGIERKRILCTVLGVFCPWVPIFIRNTGITRGYEIPCLGIMGAMILVGMALTKYGYFDSIVLAGENALHHGQEGIMVIDHHHIITFLNKRMRENFDNLELKQSIHSHKILEEVFEGKTRTLEINGKIYELRVEPLNEGGYVQGHMIWMLDITEHHKMLMQISDLAHKDSLTGVYNRSYFVTILDEYLKNDGNGSLFMMDLNHFKQINDRFGHQAGDEILENFGKVLLEQGEDVVACRIGGDEFCLFCKEMIDAKELEAFAEKISNEFAAKNSKEKYAGIVDVSFGISRILEPSDRVFEKLYSNADKALYVAKNRSKNAWYIL